MTLLKYRNMLDLGVKPEDFAATQRYYTTSKIQAGSDEWSVLESAINYIVPIVFSLILFIFIFAYGQTVAQSIATEKTSRVMELLLTSVRPLAVVIAVPGHCRTGSGYLCRNGALRHWRRHHEDNGESGGADRAGR